MQKKSVKVVPAVKKDQTRTEKRKLAAAKRRAATVAKSKSLVNGQTKKELLTCEFLGEKNGRKWGR